MSNVHRMKMESQMLTAGQMYLLDSKCHSLQIQL